MWSLYNVPFRECRSVLHSRELLREAARSSGKSLIQIWEIMYAYSFLKEGSHFGEKNSRRGVPLYLPDYCEQELTLRCTGRPGLRPSTGELTNVLRQ
jgi:hypothetical protein